MFYYAALKTATSKWENLFIEHNDKGEPLGESKYVVATLKSLYEIPNAFFSTKAPPKKFK